MDLSTVKFEVKYDGSLKKKDNVYTIPLDVCINDEHFEYSLGIGHIKTLQELKRCGKKFFRIQLAVEHEKELSRPLRMLLVPSPHAQLGFEKPRLEDILHCLFIDSEAMDSCFEVWCDNFGFDNDSIKAQKTYQACVYNGIKLKKSLGSKYYEVKQYIESLEV